MSKSLSTVVLSIVVFAAFSVGASPAAAQIGLPGHVKMVDLDEESAKLFSVIKFEGGIFSPVDEEFKELLQKIPAGTRVIIDLDSPGGQNVLGYRIIDAITEAKKTLTVDTFVDNGANCSSMCIAVFMQGQKRIAGERSSFMFHGSATWYTNVPQQIVTQEYVDALVTAGASKTWLQKLWEQGVFTEPTEFWVSGQELFEESSNMVTKVKPRLVKHKPWQAPFDPQIRPR